MSAEIPAGFVLRNEGGIRAIVDSALAAVPLDRFLADGESLSVDGGRGAVRRLDLEGAEGTVRGIARDLRRGGALRKVLPDAFLDRDRVFDELRAFCALRSAGVPTLRPVAALSARSGVLSRQRLVTEWVEGAVPVPQCVRDDPSGRIDIAERCGVALRRAFDAGLIHRDLHPDNLLVDREGQILVIDLDRAEVTGTPLSEDEVDRMLVRAARYAVKHAARFGEAPGRPEAMAALRGLGLEARIETLEARLLEQLRRRNYA